MANVYLAAGAAETSLSSVADDLFAALLAGKRKFGKINRVDTSRLSSDSAACVEFLDNEQKEGENLIQTIMRRVLPGFARLPAADTVIWAGVKANAEFIEHGAWSAKPACPFPHLPRHYSRWTRDQLGYKNAELMEVGAACASSTLGMALAADLIVSGRSKTVLVAAADIITSFGFTGFNVLFSLTCSECRPFDVDRDGLLLGDGAVVLLLCGEDCVEDLGLTPMARVTGWGATNDANHITGPARDGRGLIAAVMQALRKADVKPGDIGAFCAHGTGTIYNDAMEMTAIEKLFADRPFPVFSIKGAIGHTLGAAGGIEALVCARALAEGVVPPTAGLRCAEPASRGRVSNEKQTFEKKRILTSSSGFGGVNVALILENV